MRVNQLAIELDGGLVDIDAHQVAMAKLYYGPTYTKDEYAEIPYVVPEFFVTAPPLAGALGALRRLFELEPRMFLHIITDRPDRFRMDSQAWVDKWIDGWKMPPHQMSLTSDFRLVPAQLYVVAERHDKQLEGLKTVRSVKELVGGTQDTLDFQATSGAELG